MKLLIAATSKAHGHNTGPGASQRGVGLIEVLIALVVFALGVVSMAGLQLRTMSITLDSAQRTYVVTKSQDIADRIRANGVPVMNYLNTPTNPYNDSFCDGTGAPTSCSDTEGADVDTCTAAEMPLFDLYDVFCVGDGRADGRGDSRFESQVADWEMIISCSVEDSTGVPVASLDCTETGATVDITTTWLARSADRGDTDDPEGMRDQMTLRFVP